MPDAALLLGSADHGDGTWFEQAGEVVGGGHALLLGGFQCGAV